MIDLTRERTRSLRFLMIRFINFTISLIQTSALMKEQDQSLTSMVAMNKLMQLVLTLLSILIMSWILAIRKLFKTEKLRMR